MQRRHCSLSERIVSAATDNLVQKVAISLALSYCGADANEAHTGEN